MKVPASVSYTCVQRAAVSEDCRRAAWLGTERRTRHQKSRVLSTSRLGQDRKPRRSTTVQTTHGMLQSFTAS